MTALTGLGSVSIYYKASDRRELRFSIPDFLAKAFGLNRLCEISRIGKFDWQISVSPDIPLQGRKFYSNGRSSPSPYGMSISDIKPYKLTKTLPIMKASQAEFLYCDGVILVNLKENTIRPISKHSGNMKYGPTQSVKYFNDNTPPSVIVEDEAIAEPVSVLPKPVHIADRDYFVEPVHIVEDRFAYGPGWYKRHGDDESYCVVCDSRNFGCSDKRCPFDGNNITVENETVAVPCIPVEIRRKMLIDAFDRNAAAFLGAPTTPSKTLKGAVERSRIAIENNTTIMKLPTDNDHRQLIVMKKLYQLVQHNDAAAIDIMWLLDRYMRDNDWMFGDEPNDFVKRAVPPGWGLRTMIEISNKNGVGAPEWALVELSNSVRHYRIQNEDDEI